MNTVSFIQNYIEKMKVFQGILLEYLENEDTEEDNFNRLLHYINEQQLSENKHEFKVVLRSISQIIFNYHTHNDYFNKFERIIKFYKEKIQNYYTNVDIFFIFKNNKKILFFLFKEQILIPDLKLSKIIQQFKYERKFYPQFFYPEFKSFYSDDFLNRILEDHPEINSDNFEERRNIGEEDSKIIDLIKNDSIIEFVTFSTQNNLNLSTLKNFSIFETNSFLHKQKEYSLIELAAFYGSIQIFNFLRLNNVDLSPNLWLYAIHGQNAEIFHLLEENNVQVNSYDKLFKEAIKCHHNDFADYIRDNLLCISYSKDVTYVNSIDYSFHFLNFQYLQINEFDENLIFKYACKYDYYPIVDFLLQNGNIDINDKMPVFN